MRRLLLLPLLVLLVLLVPDLATAAPAPASGFGWPLRGTPPVTRAFEPPRTAWGAGHRGVDLRAEPGALVVAAGPGRVAYAGLLAGRGVVVVAHADGLRTTYEPVDATVHVGEEVLRGDPLGRLGRGHASCRVGTTCLHWGLLRGGTYLDPLALLGGHAVRLLPLRPADRAAAGPLTTGPEAGARPQTKAAATPRTPAATGPRGHHPGGGSAPARTAGAIALAAGGWLVLRRS